VALVGESGSGKTTLLRLFNRMVEPTEGEVRVRGRRVAAEDPVAPRRSLGYVQQEGGLLPHWTVARNVGLVPALLGEAGGWSEARRRERVREVLALVGLPEERYGARYPRELSGGQRQRVSIARAFLKNSPILILDEATSALDNESETIITRAIEKLADTRTTIVIAHRLSTIVKADRLLVMNEGRIVETGTHDEVLAQGGYYSELYHSVYEPGNA